MIARTMQFMESVLKDIQQYGKAFIVLADVTNPESITNAMNEALKGVTADFPLQAVVYNAAARIELPFEKLTQKHMDTSYKLNVLAPFLIFQRAVKVMAHQGFGTLLVTGATSSIRGNPNFVAFASTKSGLYAMTQSMAKELGPKGIHVAHVVIDGGVANSRIRHMRPDIPWERGTSMDPEKIAEGYWYLHEQEWSCWTFNLDMRPFNEKF